MTNTQRHRAARTQKSREVTPERIKELTNLGVSAVKEMAMCCCHFEDLSHPCPQHAWEAWEVFMVARQGKFPRVLDLQTKSKLFINIHQTDYWGRLGIPNTFCFRNAGSAKMVRPHVVLCWGTSNSHTAQRVGQGTRLHHTQTQLGALIAQCVDEGIKRNPLAFAATLSNTDNVALLEKYNSGYNAVRFHMRPA